MTTAPASYEPDCWIGSSHAARSPGATSPGCSKVIVSRTSPVISARPLRHRQNEVPQRDVHPGDAVVVVEDPPLNVCLPIRRDRDLVVQTTIDRYERHASCSQPRHPAII